MGWLPWVVLVEADSAPGERCGRGPDEPDSAFDSDNRHKIAGHDALQGGPWVGGGAPGSPEAAARDIGLRHVICGS